MITEMTLPRPLRVQPEELEVLSPAEGLSTAEWALARRQLSRKTTRFHGPWSHDYAPFLVEPMESLSDPFVGQVTVMASVQSGKTEILLNWLGRTADEQPAPTLIVMPTENDTRRRVVARIRPMFEATPSLHRHIKGDAGRINIGEATVLDNMILYLGWAGSPAALADNPCCNVALDEVGKFPARSGKEADPVSLAKDRMTTFGLDATLYVASTVVLENDLIDREYKLGDRRQWWARCPLCGRRHVPGWLMVELDKDPDGRLLSPKEYESGGHARYRCPVCRKVLTERTRWQAMSSGLWLPEGCRFDKHDKVTGHIPVTRHRSYRITAMMLHPAFMTVDRLAKEWAEADIARKNNDTGPLQKFVNSRLTQPWKEAESKTEIDVLRPHIGNTDSGIVPAGVKMLTAGADVQKDHIWVTLLGWGYMSECWLIYAGRLETGDTRVMANYDPLRKFAASTWPMAREPKTVMRTAITAVDCGYRPDTVIDFCSQCTESRVIAVRGSDSVKAAVYRAFRLPDKKTTRFDLNVTVLKDRLFRLLFESEAPGPGYMHLPADVTAEILKQLASEEKRVIKTKSGRRVRLWVVKDGVKANHIWDDCVYAAFAAELAGVRLISAAKTGGYKIIGRPVKKRPIRTKY